MISNGSKGLAGIIPARPSYKLYLWSYRKQGVFHEHLVNTIMDDLVKALNPHYIKVTGTLNIRGGIGIKVEVEHIKTPNHNLKRPLFLIFQRKVVPWSYLADAGCAFQHSHLLRGLSPFISGYIMPVRYLCLSPFISGYPRLKTFQHP